jgi:hypothetical protein
MKSTYRFLKIIFTVTIVFSAIPALAQYTYFSCDTREECQWDTVSQNFADCQKSDENSLFKLNKEKTMFEHTTENLKSAYYVTKYEFDDVNEVDVYDVTSDVGNKYTFILDDVSSEIRIVGTSKDGSIYMLRMHVKQTWSD